MSRVTLRVAGLVVLLAVGLLDLFGSFPASASSGLPSPVVQIPGDYPLPGPGEQVVVEVPEGADIQLTGDASDPASWIPSLDGADLLLEQVTGGVLRFKDFFTFETRPATLTLSDGFPLFAPDLLAVIVEFLGDGEPYTLEILSAVAVAPAAGGPSAAGGGGELFGLVPIISWLLDRLDFISETQAAEPEQMAALADTPLLAQLLAQFRIAREAAVLEAAMAYEAASAARLEDTQYRLEAGSGGRADLEQARAVHLEAQLEVKEAEYRRVLAIDAHQDEFDDRLLKAAYPDWRDEPPRGLEAIRAAVTPDLHNAARRYGRQQAFAEDTKQLLETLVAVALDVRDAYGQQFELGQRTLLEIAGAERVLFQTRVRLAQRNYDLKSAEAWLLSATGKLSPDYIRRPGWQ